MLKQHSDQIQLAVRLSDALVCLGAFFAAYALRSQQAVVFSTPVPMEAHYWMLGASMTTHLILYPYFRFYESLRLKSIADIVAMIAKAAVVEFFTLGTLVFLIQAKTTSRYFFGLFLGINYGLLLVEKLGARTILSSVRRRGYNYRQVLVVGTGKSAKKVILSLRRMKQSGYLPCGLLHENGQESPPKEMEGLPILGPASRLEEVTRTTAVDEVVFAVDRLEGAGLESQIELCEKLGIPARFSLGFLDLTNLKVGFGEVDGLPIVTFHRYSRTPIENALKRSMDILISLIGLAITALLYPWISWRIRRESPGPVIFKQPRVGENGRTFKCYKFRTMYADAEARKSELAQMNQMAGPLFKIANDPRITPFGAFLRRTSLDELPQFFNILRGDMSVVGTRPPTPDEVNRYETHYRRRLSIRPGLTGLWQVSGRNEIKNFEDVLALDLKYIDRWSIWLDIQIISRTIWVIFFRRGAY